MHQIQSDESGAPHLAAMFRCPAHCGNCSACTYCVNTRTYRMVRCALTAQGGVKMGLWGHMNERVKKLTAVDISLIKWSAFFGTIIIVKLFPRLLNINYVVLIALLVVCSVKPVYKFWIKK